MIKIAITVICLTLTYLSCQNSTYAQEKMQLHEETYDFSQPAIQYNPNTNSWEPNNALVEKQRKSRHIKKNLKNKTNESYNIPSPHKSLIQYNPNNTSAPKQDYYPRNSQYHYQQVENYYQGSINQSQQILIPSGTPVVAYVEKIIDADDVSEGQEITLLVQEPVKIQGQTVIKANTPIIAQVTKKKNNFIFGVPGEIEVSNFKVKMSDGNLLNLRGNISHKGQNRYWVDVVSWFFLWPFLFIKGEDGKIQPGVHQVLYTVGETYLNY